MSSHVSHQGGDQEGLADDLSGARIHRESLHSASMLRFLQQYPSARLVRGANRRAIAKALKGPYVGDKLTFSAEDILRAAKTSIGTVSPAKEIIVQGKIATLLHLQERLDEMTKLLTDLCKATRIEDLKILRSIKGVGLKTAAPFLAEMGEVKIMLPTKSSSLLRESILLCMNQETISG